jgi:hypothetical protein
MVRASMVVVAVFVPLIAFHLWIVPRLESGGEKLIPYVGTAEEVVVLGAAALAIGVLVAVLVRRVRPSWRGMPVWLRSIYVAAVFALETAVFLGAAVGLCVSQGGLKLFEPTFVRAAAAPDGRVAYLYEGGLLSCSYDIYVAPRYGLSMALERRIERNVCDARPRVRWARDGAPELVGRDGLQLQSEPIKGFPLFGLGGC